MINGIFSHVNDSDGSKKKHNHTSSFLSPTSHSKVTQNLFISMPDSFELSGIAFKVNVEIDIEFATEIQQQASECFERHNRPPQGACRAAIDAMVPVASREELRRLRFNP